MIVMVLYFKCYVELSLNFVLMLFVSVNEFLFLSVEPFLSCL